jgi:hypothetical protein
MGVLVIVGMYQWFNLKGVIDPRVRQIKQNQSGWDQIQDLCKLLMKQ